MIFFNVLSVVAYTVANSCIFLYVFYYCCFLTDNLVEWKILIYFIHIYYL